MAVVVLYSRAVQGEKQIMQEIYNSGAVGSCMMLYDTMDTDLNGSGIYQACLTCLPRSFAGLLPKDGVLDGRMLLCRWFVSRLVWCAIFGANLDANGRSPPSQHALFPDRRQ